jgi:hypothetical protein
MRMRMLSKQGVETVWGRRGGIWKGRRKEGGSERAKAKKGEKKRKSKALGG